MHTTQRFTRFFFGTFGVGAIATILCLTGCKQPIEKLTIRPVRTMIVGDFNGLTSQTFPGRAAAGQEANLSFRVGGPLVELPIKKGDVVKKGVILAQIDKRDYEVALRSAQGSLAQAKAKLAAMKAGARPEEILRLEASLDSAKAISLRTKADFKRAKQLLPKGVITQEDYDIRLQDVKRADANLRRASEELRIGKAGARAEDIQAQESEILSLKASVDAAADKLKYTTLLAPFDGLITERKVENHETVVANQEILRLLDTSYIKLEVNLPEQSMVLLPHVDKIYCNFPQLGNLEVEAKIEEISYEASQTTRTYPVKLIMKQPAAADKQILPGMAGFARSTITKDALAKLKHLEIPETAIFAKEDGKKYVWIVDESKKTVHSREIEPDVTTPRGIRVKGIKPGEVIVTAGTHYLREGDEVRLSGKKAPTGKNPEEVSPATDSQYPADQNSDQQGGK